MSPPAPDPMPRSRRTEANPRPWTRPSAKVTRQAPPRAPGERVLQPHPDDRGGDRRLDDLRRHRSPAEGGCREADRVRRGERRGEGDGAPDSLRPQEERDEEEQVVVALGEVLEAQEEELSGTGARGDPPRRQAGRAPRSPRPPARGASRRGDRGRGGAGGGRAAGPPPTARYGAPLRAAARTRSRRGTLRALRRPPAPRGERGPSRPPRCGPRPRPSPAPAQALAAERLHVGRGEGGRARDAGAEPYLERAQAGVVGRAAPANASASARARGPAARRAVERIEAGARAPGRFAAFPYGKTLLYPVSFDRRHRRRARG